jgi:hypothetical protein
MAEETFEALLTGGHPNSLGRTLEVVDFVLADPSRLEALYQCYFSTDEVVRLRVSNAMKRITLAHPDWVVTYIDRLISEISLIKQASTQWTLAQLFLELQAHLTPAQRTATIAIMQRNLTEWHDWIVLNQTMMTLTAWAKDDDALKDWLMPQLARLQDDPRTSVAKTALKCLKALTSKRK